MTTEPKWNVGDEVIVTGRYASRGRKKIVKVGRVYFYVEGNPDTAFKLADGWQKHDGYGNYLAQCRTPEQYEADTVREEVMAKLHDHGVVWANGWGGSTFRESNFSTARLFELLHLIDQIAADNTKAEAPADNTKAWDEAYDSCEMYSTHRAQDLDRN